METDSTAVTTKGEMSPARHYGRAVALYEMYKEKVAEETKSRWSRKSAQNTLAEEAQTAYTAGDYELALNKFLHFLAVLESDLKSVDREIHASLVSNVGSCLHRLECVDDAKEYYQQALDYFTNCPTGRVTWLFYGDINQRRVEFIKSRLGDIALGAEPDPTKYLDANGKEQHWSKRQIAAAKDPDSTWSAWVSPRSWYRWYYTPLNKQEGGAGDTSVPL